MHSYPCEQLAILLCVYVCVYVRICVCICVRMCAYISVYMYVYVCIYVRICVCMCAYMCVYVCIYGGRYHDISVAHINMVLHKYLQQWRTQGVRHGYACHLFQRRDPHLSVAHAFVMRHWSLPYAWRTPNSCATDMGVWHPRPWCSLGPTYAWCTTFSVRHA
jgi:hypothetical protein